MPDTATCEPTLTFLASEIRAICLSTQNIEQDTSEIKTTMKEIEGEIDTLTTRVSEAEDHVATLEFGTVTMKGWVESRRNCKNYKTSLIIQITEHGRKQRHDTVLTEGNPEYAGMPV